jgi:hypothetical protein
MLCIPVKAATDSGNNLPLSPFSDFSVSHHIKVVGLASHS